MAYAPRSGLCSISLRKGVWVNMQVDPTYARRRETASELVQGGRAWSARAPCLRVLSGTPAAFQVLDASFGAGSIGRLTVHVLKLDWTARLRLAEPRLHE